MADKDIEMRDNGPNDKDIKMQNSYDAGSPPPAPPRRRAMVVS
jgi:hypothetical protein